MPKWLLYLKNGMTAGMPNDHIRGKQGASDFFKNFKLIFPFAKSFLRLGVFGGIFLFISFLLNLPQPLVWRYLIDKVILAHDLQLLAWGGSIWVGLLLGTKIAGMLENYYFTLFQQKVTLNIQNELLSRTLHFPKSFFDKTETGYLMSRLTSDIHGLEWFFSSNIVNIVNQTLRFAGGIIFLFYLEWRLALPVIVSIPITWLSSWYFAKRLYILNHRQQEQKAQVYRHFQETLSATPLIKSFATEKRTTKKVSRELKKMLNINLEQVLVNMLANSSNDLAFAFVRIFALTIGAYWVITGYWSLGSLLAFQGYLMFVFGPAMFLVSSNRIFQHARTSLDRVASMFNILPEENIGQGIPVKNLNKAIKFNNITFAYGDNTVLENISLKVLPGSHIAIIGESGAGKTTLINLLMRFYKAQTGEIKIDNKAIKEYELLSYRRRFGYVAQGNLLNSGTIWENLCYGNSDAKEKAIHNAAKTAQIHEFISKLPQRYDSEIGERGVTLSEGQRQRLCIARALVNDPDILILDEPTSAIDNVTESSILLKLKEVCANKTVFMIAHQQSCAKQADRIILIKNKKIIADGPHKTLLKNSKEYQQFFTKSI